MYLIFDTETSGLPSNYQGDPLDTKNWPRIVQLGFILADHNFEIQCQRSLVIRPDGFEIPQETTDIHGISTERALEEGHSITSALTELMGCIDRTKLLVAHNMNFDHPIVGCEIIRLGKSLMPWFNQINALPRLCTMLSTMDYCKLPGNFGSFKWPKLEELHRHLFQTDFPGAHSALGDCKATLACLEELVDRKVVPEPKWVDVARKAAAEKETMYQELESQQKGQ